MVSKKSFNHNGLTCPLHDQIEQRVSGNRALILSLVLTMVGVTIGSLAFFLHRSDLQAEKSSQALEKSSDIHTAQMERITGQISTLQRDIAVVQSQQRLLLKKNDIEPK